MKMKKGKAEGITATAHRIAKIIYTLVAKQVSYDAAKVFAPTEEQKAKKIDKLKKAAAALGFDLKEVA